MKHPSPHAHTTMKVNHGSVKCLCPVLYSASCYLSLVSLSTTARKHKVIMHMCHSLNLFFQHSNDNSQLVYVFANWWLIYMDLCNHIYTFSFRLTQLMVRFRHGPSLVCFFITSHKFKRYHYLVKYFLFKKNFFLEIGLLFLHMENPLTPMPCIETLFPSDSHGNSLLFYILSELIAYSYDFAQSHSYIFVQCAYTH